jgi:hypothetical protein
MMATDTERLDWLQKNHTLHRSVEILYVVIGYEVRLLVDDLVVHGEFEGEDLRHALDNAMKACP